MNNYDDINDLLVEKLAIEHKIKKIPYIGTPEIKVIGEKKYLYVRKRVLDRITSTYVGPYSDDLFRLLLNFNKEERGYRKELRSIEKKLNELGYENEEASNQVRLCIDLARRYRSRIIYDQAVLEGIATTFPDTEEIIENGKIKNANAEDIQKLLNLKHAWQFILDMDVLKSPTDYYLCSYIARMVNDGFYYNGGRIRNVPVTISGTTYIPPMPMENDVIEKMRNIIKQKKSDTEIAIDICLYIMKTQVYNDGNKRTAVIAANHYLISKGVGYLAIDHKKVPEFKKMLVNYYEGKDSTKIRLFLDKCIDKIVPNK